MASIQGVYVALFGRPADPTGLAYFNSVTNNGGDLSKIGDLAASQEYKDRFAGQSNVQIVNSIYKSLFNRDAEVGGLTFFVNALNNGELNINNIAIAILDGAQGTDKTIVDTKIKAADAYTAALDTGSEIVAYNGAAAAAAGRAFLAPVSTTEPTAAAVATAVENMVKAGTGGGTGTSGVILTLTNNPDVFTPTAASDANKTTEGNDTIRGLAAADLQSADIIDGGAGTDTLNALAPLNAVVRPVLTSVENVNLTYGVLTGAAGFNATDSSGIVKIVADAAQVTSVNTLTLSGVDKATVVELKNVVADDGVVGANVGQAVVTFKDVAGASDAATVSLNKVTLSADDSFKLSVAGIETLALNSTGSIATDTNTAILDIAATKALVLSGGHNITINNSAAGSVVTELKSVDASAFTGVLTYTASGNGETITTGQKADTINLAGGADVVVYTAAAKSTLNTLDTINNFSFTADKIDLKAFALGADTTVGTTVLLPAGDTANFFTGTNRIMLNEAQDMVYVDVNKDGVFNATSDLAIKLVGADAANLTAADFILA